MKNLRNQYTRNTTSALSSHFDHDFVIETSLQPQLTYQRLSTIFSSQLAPDIPLNPRQQDEQTARQKLREYLNLKKIHTIENLQFQSRQFQANKTQIFYPKLKSTTLKTNSRPNSLQLDQQNNFNFLNLASTQRTVNKPQDAKQTSKYLEKQLLINLELKQETQNLRTQIYELRNVEIQLQKIKIYVRKLQNQINDKNSIAFDLKQQNQQLVKKLSYFQDQLQLKLKDLQFSEKELIKAKQKIQQLTEIKHQMQSTHLQEKLQKDTYIKQIEKQSYEKSSQITQLYQQIQRLSCQVDQKQRENAQIYGHYEESLKVIEKMEQKMSQMKNQQGQMQDTWDKQVHKNELLFRQFQKVIEEKCRDSSLLQTELKQVNKELEKCKLQGINKAKQAENELNKLKKQNKRLREQIQQLVETKKNKTDQAESQKRQYVPKKWFQEKIYYEYTLSSLQNELQNLKQQNQELMKPTKQQIANQDSQQPVMLIKNSNQVLNSAQTQTEQFNLGEIELQQSQKSRIIQEQQEKILSLEKQLNQVYTEIDRQKYSLQQKYSQKLIDIQVKYQELQTKYHQERDKLLKQKQRTQDLTMELLLVNQEVQQSRVKIRSKQHL